MNLRFEPLAESHDVAAFSCKSTLLDDYLKTEALTDMRRDHARTVVCVEEGGDPHHIVGYFTLRTMIGLYVPAQGEKPDAYIHPVELAYLARDITHYGQAVGDDLMVVVFRRVLSASQYVGFPGVALMSTAEGRRLYERFDFLRLYPDRGEMFLSLRRIRTILNALADTNTSATEPTP